jgi:hypothetical protein
MHASDLYYGRDQNFIRPGVVICIMAVLILAAAGPASAATVTIDNSTPFSIQSALGTAADGDIFILQPGTYFESGNAIPANITIRANTSFGHSAEDTIIDAQQNGRLFTASGKNLTVDNLTLMNGRVQNKDGGTIFLSGGTLAISSSRIINSRAESMSATEAGGAIYLEDGVLTIDSTSFTGCFAAQSGGAIASTRSNVTITGSTFSDCSADMNSGGAIDTMENTGSLAISGSAFSGCSANYGGAVATTLPGVVIDGTSFSGCTAGNEGGAISVESVTINGSAFTRCSAISGGAIRSTSTVSITSSSFTDCTSTDGGSATLDYAGTVTIHMCRIYNNSGVAVMNGAVATIDAADNWWGSNNDPSAKASAGVTTNPWLVLNLTATPSSISAAGTSTIRTNLTRNSAGTDTTSGGIFVPDDIPAAFARTSGTGSIQPAAGKITTGANTSTFTPAGPGISTVSATVDSETVSANITVTGTTTETRIGVVRSNTTWLLDASGDGKFGAGDLTRTFGKAGDFPVTGDWDGNGITKIGVVRSNTTWLLDTSGDGKYGAGDFTYTFGKAGDVPITGDWDGDLATEIGVVRSSTSWLLDASGDGKYGAGDFTYTFGKAGDKPVTGDWSGTPATEIGVVRSNTTWLLDASGNGKFGAGDFTYTFGKAGDKPVIGDWDADVTSEIGVVRSNTTWLLDKSGDGKYGAGDLTYSFGKAGDKPVTGKWT